MAKAFPYRNEPVRTIYTLLSIFWILFRLPFWMLRNALASWRPRRNWTFLRSIIVEVANPVVLIMAEAFPPSHQSYEELATKPGFVWVEPLSEDIVVGDVKRYAEVNGVSNERTGGFWYGLEGVKTTPPTEAGPGDRVIYYLHGGGFVMGSASPSFPPTLTTTQGLLQHTSFTHIFASEYRLSSGPPLPPKNPFPACLLDVLAGYFYLVNTLKYLPENVIVAGDSAGGVLAYQLVRYCVTYRGRGGEGKAKAKAKGTTPFPLPHGLLLLSPSVDCLLRPLPGTSMITNRRSDYIAPWFDKRYAVSALMGKGLVEADLDHSWFSPGSMSDRDQEEKEMTGVIFRQFPKTMIVTGEAEMSRDCNRVLKERMEMGGQAQGGGKVVYVEVEDAPHDILTSTLWEPERTIALQRIGSWVGEF